MFVGATDLCLVVLCCPLFTFSSRLINCDVAGLGMHVRWMVGPDYF